MVKYVTHDQYRRKEASDDWRNRFPANARPINSAPERSARPVWVFEPSGEGWLAIRHLNQWQKLGPVRDDRTGATSLRMTGEAIRQPVAWASS
jgi:hypothetical protein